MFATPAQVLIKQKRRDQIEVGEESDMWVERMNQDLVRIFDTGLDWLSGDDTDIVNWSLIINHIDH